MINRFAPIHIFADNTQNLFTRCGRTWAAMAFTITFEEANATNWVKPKHAICVDCIKGNDVRATSRESI